ncbi:hypothetical protein HYY74_04930 [Candidatus Woesearchaeota archaeon]|nr:hypothetical protein [Candidatus Woesearchaeota archaeon]
METQQAEQGAVSDTVRGIRTLEEKYNNLLRRIQLGEQNTIAHTRKIHDEFRAINSDILELRKQIEEIRERMMMAIKELQTVAKREDLEIVKKYLDLWEPVNFVTQAEVEKMVRRILEEK